MGTSFRYKYYFYSTAKGETGILVDLTEELEVSIEMRRQEVPGDITGEIFFPPERLLLAWRSLFLSGAEKRRPKADSRLGLRVLVLLGGVSCLETSSYS
mmetsp:Transcript_17028/g.69262  ORF Transcript_17028/g.69262 Transcript_17028/m.69262 type:complete len:99 (-) Transcript_17028:731-1027(-)